MFYKFYSNDACYYVQTSEPLVRSEVEFLKGTFGRQVYSKDKIEIGPKLHFTTAWSTNMTNILQSIGLSKIQRVEKSRFSDILTPFGPLQPAEINPNSTIRI